ncbi:hypothetical protein [Lichenihabitans psoromatis]|uniref:hypothetical protein n=1 Tax=Lichenihabitans psoromatis TaxID=2528642 RepID=UPI00103679D4|nr:hypothetical protein [Lichenihabitans psoromatis]
MSLSEADELRRRRLYDATFVKQQIAALAPAARLRHEREIDSYLLALRSFEKQAAGSDYPPPPAFLEKRRSAVT